MLRYALRRSLRTLPVILGMTMVVFLMIHLVPGDPARSLLGPRAPEAALDAFNARYGLDQPIHEQIASWLAALARGDLGTSFSYRVPVTDLMAGRVLPTVLLLLCGAAMAVILTVPLALAGALREDGWVDHLARLVPLIGLGMPTFWLGILLLMFVALPTTWLPVGGWGDSPAEIAAALLLPSFTVAVGIAPFTVRSLRAALIETFEADFVATARAKGLRPHRVILAHALRYAVIPMVTVLGLSVGWLVGNTLIVEKVFSIPGLGSLMIDSVLEQDFAVVQALALVFGLIVVAVNLVTDIVRAALDPRVKLE
jgi:peptide/nickel transport system permease protein